MSVYTVKAKKKISKDNQAKPAASAEAEVKNPFKF